MKLQVDDDVVIRFRNDIQLDVCTHLNEDEEPVFEQRQSLLEPKSRFLFSILFRET